MRDEIMESFLQRQYDDAFAMQSDRLRIVPGDGLLPCVYHVHFASRCLIRDASGQIQEHEGFGVRICFPADYLRYAETYRVVNWLYPRNVWHPNIRGDVFAICVGRLEPGLDLLDLIYQCWAIGTWNKVTVSENDALNRDACGWARRDPRRFPVDERPFKRRLGAFDIAVNSGAASQ